MGAGISPTRGWLRLLRGTSVGLVSTLLAALGHASAGGAVADPGTLVVLGGLMTALMVALADRRPRATTLLATIGAAQLVLHGLMQVMGTHGHHLGAAPAAGKPGSMIAVHALATIAAAVLFTHADDVIFFVTAVLSRIVRRRRPPGPVPDVTALALPIGITVNLPRACLYALVVGQRGPPVPE